MRVLYDRVAAIDVHKDMVKVAIRVPESVNLFGAPLVGFY